jgi:organic radical activating enzyme
MNSEKLFFCKKTEKFYKEIEKLEKYYFLPRFSSSEFFFYPTQEDWKIIKQYIPKIMLNITNRCNTFCKICITNSSPYDFSQELSKEEILLILKRIGRGKRVVLIGGEPTVREDLIDIIKLIKASGNQPELFTNGIKLASFEYAKKLKDAGIKRVYLSLDSLRENYYEIMNGNRNLLWLKLLALKNLNLLKIDTVIAMRVVKNLNIEDIEPILNLCINSVKRKGTIRGIIFHLATPYGRFQLDRKSIMSLEEFLCYLRDISRGEVNVEYFIESKRLLILLHQLFSKLNIPFSFGSGGLVGLFRVGSIRQLLPLDLVKEINNDLETKKFHRLLWKLFTRKELRTLVGRVIKEIIKKKFIETISIPGSFFVEAGFVNSPLGRSPIVDLVQFSKGINKTKPMINYYSTGGTKDAL